MLYYVAKEVLFLKSLGIPEEDIIVREIPKEELPHYSAYNYDIEVISTYGSVEVIGNAFRTDYDVKNHSEKSGVDMSVDGKFPLVIEPSFGVERIMLMILEKSFVPKDKSDRKYGWLRLNPKVAPYLVGVIPLLKNKEELVSKAREVFRMLFKELRGDVIYLQEGSIGKMYSKLDSLGVPYVITIDHQTLRDNTVTLRFRDTREQERVEIEKLPNVINRLVESYPKFEI
jgi:glycyl-tRNA synthetase